MFRYSKKKKASVKDSKLRQNKKKKRKFQAFKASPPQKSRQEHVATIDDEDEEVERPLLSRKKTARAKQPHHDESLECKFKPQL